MSGYPGYDDDQALVAGLQALPRERIPPAGTWDAIAARIAAEAAVPAAAIAPAPTRRVRRRWPLAAAAALAALAVGFGLDRLGTPAPSAQTALERQAQALDRDYRVALALLPAAPGAGAGEGLAPALEEIDRSTAAIHAAIRQTPDAGFLLEQLQRTYALRLDLTRRAVLDAAFHDRG